MEERHKVPISVAKGADNERDVTDRQGQVVHALPFFKTLLLGAATCFSQARPKLVLALAVQNVAKDTAENEAPEDHLAN